MIERIVYVFMLDVFPHGIIFLVSSRNILSLHKSQSTWHENILKIFNDVAWNMFQRFLLAPLSQLADSPLIACCSPISIVDTFYRDSIQVGFVITMFNPFCEHNWKTSTNETLELFIKSSCFWTYVKFAFVSS